MPDQFVVPQFIDTEDKIIGPITGRQFIILLVVVLLDATLYKLLLFNYFLLVGIPLFIIGVVFAFAKVNGVSFHYFVLNLLQTFRRPRLRVWDKQKTDDQLRTWMLQKPEEVPLPEVRKAPPQGSRLHEITLVVDTGGTYKPEE
ncbi:TPA: hypothetical protein DEP34_02110 [Candidatus Uhrbacteria bacterium]|uniref:PrgI family protein n=2 Tax=Candidatus Uhriibacteriota TaxID=1752732 RepID=A0A0G1SFP8_9BACT|nr:MAG: hypothetical protein UX45_C0014G0016 [Candidatus Uhrbacteria bacterium GW2011_GWF2_46_218]KKU40908.1 MAG: hypothetical protein UX57_C0008G0020 [Candidatus Uhrbacteria bacterium GW2011_GWE2_46_68]HBK33972.1 hypothetical protein [Candidatus Uhrbacteria bacterium]HCB19156.1 hypothetical protein [Candidatus Uhrbacteria bacterium]